MTDKHKSNCIVNYRPKPDARIRLFCFSYAGGGAQIYRRWPENLPPEVDVCAVQFPGRGARLREKPFDGIDQFVDEAARALDAYSDKPFVFFGHSMGALISFELARRLRREGRALPLQLFVSGHATPREYESEPHLAHLPDAELIEELKRLEGTPAEVLDNRELMQLLLPIIRADFLACENYVYSTEPPLACPVSAFGGVEDKDVSRENLEAWHEETSLDFSLRMFPGGHFFLHTSERLILESLARELSQMMRKMRT